MPEFIKDFLLRCTLLIFVISLGESPAEAAALNEPPEEIRITLQPQKGYGGLMPHSGILTPTPESNPWAVLYPQPEAIPEKLRDRAYHVMHMTHDFVQHAWQSYTSGALDSAFVHRALNNWGTNPADLTDQYLNLHTVIIVWEDEEGDTFLMHSSQPPYSFEDAEIFQVPVFGMSDKESAPLSLPVTFEIFRNGIVQEIESYIRFNIREGFRMPGFEGVPLFYGYYQHLLGSFEFQGEVWEAALHNNFMSPVFGTEGDIVQVRRQGEAWSSEIKPGQFADLNGEFWQFTDTAFDGSEILLRQMPAFAELRGTQIGLRALPFEQESVEGELISLDDELGNWVFLDFWGTWCGPCIAEMPYLIEAWRLFEGPGFQFIGIANDNRETLARFSEEWGISWPQLISHGSESNALNELYGIRGWPTTMLLDPEGVIVQQSVRGFGLETKLAAELGFDDERADRLREGEVLVEIPEALIESFLAETNSGDNDEARSEAIMVEVQGARLPFRGRIPLYLHNGSWVRGLTTDPELFAETGQEALELRIFVNGEAADLPLPQRFVRDEEEVRYRFAFEVH